MVFVTFFFPQVIVSFAFPVFFFAVNFTFAPLFLFSFRSFLPLASSFQVTFPFKPYVLDVNVMDFFGFTVDFPLTFITGFFTVTLHTAFTPLPSVAFTVIFAVPGDFAVTFPLWDTLAMDFLSTEYITFWDAAAGVTFALSCKVWYAYNFLDVTDKVTLLARIGFCGALCILPAYVPRIVPVSIVLVIETDSVFPISPSVSV